MPREDVPYPSRALCSLKCQIDALNNKINELMKSINGVQGDGQGDLSLVSGDAAIVINNDAAQHEVEISLDQSQLPSALVSSVNGQIGAVDLDATDIPMNPGQSTPTVQNVVAANSGDITNLQNALAQEITDRGNADSTLQTNINAANAAITGKVDKLTTAGTSAYTHNGSTQGEIAVIDGTTSNTIPIRDGNGRMQAADPASGATDKTLVTANWVSQTGPGRPNNLIHNNGNETINGIKTYTNCIEIERPTGLMLDLKNTSVDRTSSFTSYADIFKIRMKDKNNLDMIWIDSYVDNNDLRVLQIQVNNNNGTSNGYFQFRVTGAGVKTISTNFPKPSNW